MNKKQFFIILINIISFYYFVSYTLASVHPGELTVVNNSERKLTIKIMKAGNDKKYYKFTETVIKKTGEKTLYFSETGNFYLKTMAEYPKRAAIYTKGDPFKIYVGNDGYSVLTITITIKEENNVKNPLSQLPITKGEFEKDKE